MTTSRRDEPTAPPSAVPAPLAPEASDASALLPAGWHQMDLSQRVTALAESDQADQIVPALPADELFHLVRATGFDTALVLLPYVTPEQWLAFVDLDGWEGDAPDLSRFEVWFQAAEAAGGDVPEALLLATEEEYLVAVLQGVATIHEKDLDVDFVPDDREIFQSPDGEFWIDAPKDHPDTALVRRALLHLYAADLPRARRILRATRWELESPLVLEADRFRRARLADLGYPSWEEAMELLYTRVTADALREAWRQAEATGATGPLRRERDDAVAPSGLVPADRLRRGRPLREALDRLDAKERDAALGAVTLLAHAFSAAHKLDLGEWDDHLVALERAVGMLDLGLSLLGAADPDRAADALRRVHPTLLYRLGQTAVSERVDRARAVLRRVGPREELARFGAPVGEALQMALLPVPSAYGALDFEGRPVPEAFRSPEQLAALDAALQRAEGVLVYLEQQLGYRPGVLDGAPWHGVSEDARAQVRFDTLFLTALLHRLVHGAFALAPLSPEEARAGLDQLLEAEPDAETGVRGLRPAVTRALALGPTRLSGGEAGAEVQAFVREALERLADELGALPPGEAPDPRFLADLLLLRSR